MIVVEITHGCEAVNDYKSPNCHGTYKTIEQGDVWSDVEVAPAPGWKMVISLNRHHSKDYYVCPACLEQIKKIREAEENTE